MKVYVMTKAKLFQPEIYVGVKKSLKEAEKALRSMSPHMREAERMPHGPKCYYTDSSKTMLYFIHEEEI